MSIAAPAEPAAIGLRGRWYAFRDRLLQDARFQRWAGGFALTRPIARKRQMELFDLVAGFVYSQALHAVVKLKLLPLLARLPARPVEIARALELPAESVDRLLTAALALRLVNRRGAERYGLGDLGAALLANPGVLAMIEHHATLYADLADPVDLLRRPDQETQLAQYWAYARAGDPAALSAGQVAEYSALMGISQGFIREEILDAYPVGRHRQVLDIGGGEGAFVREAAARCPQTQFAVFDLPAVAERAEATFGAAGLGARAQAIGGDLFAGDLPTGHDLACLIRVLYDHDDARAARILAAARGSLGPDGVLLIAEPMAETPGAERVGAYFAFYLLAMKGGQSRSFDRLAGMARAAGFRRIERIATRTPMLTSLLVARP
jgi:demethylspheroidene O-methyltransferase